MIGAVGVNQLGKTRPRNPLQYIVENAILMPHGVDPISVSNSSRNDWMQVESMPCTLSTKSKPDSSGLDRGIQKDTEGGGNLDRPRPAALDHPVKPGDDGNDNKEDAWKRA
jgi:hypothetical protein